MFRWEKSIGGPVESHPTFSCAFELIQTTTRRDWLPQNPVDQGCDGWMHDARSWRAIPRTPRVKSSPRAAPPAASDGARAESAPAVFPPGSAPTKHRPRAGDSIRRARFRARHHPPPATRAIERRPPRRHGELPWPKAASPPGARGFENSGPTCCWNPRANSLRPDEARREFHPFLIRAAAADARAPPRNHARVAARPAHRFHFPARFASATSPPHRPADDRTKGFAHASSRMPYAPRALRLRWLWDDVRSSGRGRIQLRVFLPTLNRTRHRPATLRPADNDRSAMRGGSVSASASGPRLTGATRPSRARPKTQSPSGCAAAPPSPNARPRSEVGSAATMPPVEVRSPDVRTSFPRSSTAADHSAARQRRPQAKVKNSFPK